jgi:hypothetical protein
VTLGGVHNNIVTRITTELRSRGRWESAHAHPHLINGLRLAFNTHSYRNSSAEQAEQNNTLPRDNPELGALSGYILKRLTLLCATS